MRARGVSAGPGHRPGLAFPWPRSPPGVSPPPRGLSFPSRAPPVSGDPARRSSPAGGSPGLSAPSRHLRTCARPCAGRGRRRPRPRAPPRSGLGRSSVGALADSRDRPPRPAPRLAGAGFPRDCTQPSRLAHGSLAAQRPESRQPGLDPGSRGGAAAAGQKGVGDRAPSLPGLREPRAAFLSPTSRPAILRVSAVVVPASVLACMGVFCGPETGKGGRE